MQVAQRLTLHQVIIVKPYNSSIWQLGNYLIQVPILGSRLCLGLVGGF